MEAREYQLMYALEKDHWWFVGKRWAAAALLAGVEPIDGLRLDLGAGTGALLEKHLNHGPALGIELDPQALALARRRVGARLVRAYSDALPLAGGSATLVTVMDLLYHQGVDVMATLAECHRVLKPGGHILVFDLAYQGLMGPHDRVMHGARRFARQGLKLRLEHAGFTVLLATYRNSLLAPPFIAARWCERLLGPGPGRGPAAGLAQPFAPGGDALGRAMVKEARPALGQYGVRAGAQELRRPLPLCSVTLTSQTARVILFL